MIATVADEELHVATDVTSCVLPSVYVPVAVNACVVPSAIVAVGGLIAIDTSVAGFTTSVAVPLTVPELIPIVVVPVPAVLACPIVPAVPLIVATVAAVELQCPLCVRSCVVPSVKVPVAVNCCVVPSGIVAIGGLIAIDTSAAPVTVSTVDPLTVPDVALTVAVPVPTLCPTPALLIVAVAGVSELHVAVLVRVCVLPSVYVPVAVKACAVPSARVGVAGVTAIDTNAAPVTVSVVDPLTPPSLAVMFALPTPALLATAGVGPPVLIVLTPGVSELHSTVPVMFCVLPSVYVPVAVNACVVPSGTTGTAGVTAIETSTAGLTVTVVEPLIAPDAAVTVVLPNSTLLATPCVLTVAMLESAMVQIAVFVTTRVLPSL
jgi:hypothetical protein